MSYKTLNFVVGGGDRNLSTSLSFKLSLNEKLEHYMKIKNP